MSAIWGFYSFKSVINENIAETMTSSYERRCKIDRYSSVLTDKLYSACGIQYVTKEAEFEQLPINDEVNHIVFNADAILDNREELLSELKINDAATPDGTIMYRAYLKWGIDCLHHFLGLFSIAVYDGREDCLYLASDYCSQRVLNYKRTSEGVYFSTLIDPIRNMCPDVKINDDYVLDFINAPGMMPNLSGEETAFAGIFKLEPGTYFKFTPEKTEKIRYFTLDNTNPLFQKDIPVHTGSLKNYGIEFVELYKKCVGSALRTSDNLGISMSSGLDSASVSVLAADMLKEENKNLYAYTYVPYGEYANTKNIINDEAEDVKKIVGMHPNILTHFLSNNGANCLENLKDLIDTLEMPLKAYGNLPSLCEIYEKARTDGCRIVLTGQFGNSTVSHGLIDDILLDLYEKKQYLTFLKWLNTYSKHVRESRKQALRGCKRYFDHAINVKKEKDYGLADYKSDNEFVHIEKDPGYKAINRFHNSGINNMANIPTDCKDYHEGLMRSAPFSFIGDYETKLGLKYGIVLRDPTRDIRMIYFCSRLPYKVFAFGGTPRWLIRNNLREVLPIYLLDNWNRYGMQNADCYERIVRDKETVFPMLEEMLSEDKYGVIDVNEVKKALFEIQSIKSQPESLTFDHIVFSSIFCYFNKINQR